VGDVVKGDLDRHVNQRLVSAPFSQELAQGDWGSLAGPRRAVSI
jgi:hypothetical protein